MDDDKGRVSSQDAATNGFLIAQDHGGGRRSSVSSARSDVSTHTFLEDNPNFQPPKIERHQTERARVRIKSRWACLLGFIFGPSIAEKYCDVTLDKPDMNSGYGRAFDDEHCPFFKTLSVISRHDDRRRIEERCAFDTMSLVGNIVSLKFATRLGYQVDKFKRLEHSERSAQSSSGHLLKPMGAVYLSWYHNTSPQYTNMRFLVVDDFHYDLLIGAETIYRHNMMSPPTFATHIRPGDKELQDLLAERGRIADRRKAFKTAHKANPNNVETKENLEKTKRLWSLKELQVEERELRNALDKDPQNSEKNKLVEQKRTDIKKFIEKNGSENDLDTEYKPPPELPVKVVIQTPTGLTERSTGRSIKSKSASSSATGAQL